MQNCVEIPLPGTQADLTDLFSYSKEDQSSKLTSLPEFVAHVFNKTLQYDRHCGGWSQVLKQEDGQYMLKMYSPHQDLSPYRDRIPAFMAAGHAGLAIYKSLEKEIEEQGKGQIRFLLPAGLSMARTRSVQLLHFPPLETFVYKDYLYSPTNRRWENLLGNNGLADAHLPELETIVDCVPLAAPGDDSAGIAAFNDKFVPYVKDMLRARLTITGNRTQPVVAYGGPVRDFLKLAFPDQIPAPLDVLSLVELRLFDDPAVVTPVLCANHPSMYLYYTDDTNPKDAEAKKNVMTQDLIAAGWQARMAYDPAATAASVLDEMKAHWTDNPKVLDIIRQEDTAYSYRI
jgi:hypothetical protein